ncbi:MAG: phosphoribosylanthranilate isomerase [Acidobacteriota bacterium]|jgi:phosphoribosylanthranilate isomerase|nr:phosphoribosylanthranilate isomerase [Acidobacteriota bacterium]
MKVKVCGITTYEDARMALDLGVDALGFNFFPGSPRRIRPEDARGIIRRLPAFAVSVGLFVDVPAPAQVAEAAAAAGVGVIQLHGDESPGYCRELGGAGLPLIKAFRVGENGADIAACVDAYDVRAYLFDAKDDALFGGTGKSFDWDLVKDVARRVPVVLAGGLRPDNVGRAARTVRPYALDVCSGVESAPGRKDAGKLRDFMNEVGNVSSSADRA